MGVELAPGFRFGGRAGRHGEVGDHDDRRHQEEQKYGFHAAALTFSIRSLVAIVKNTWSKLLFLLKKHSTVNIG
jgi:hypothetical protein